jgi:hypothetical protein
MEDLVPFIFFIVIVAVNGLKFLVERAGKKSAREKSDHPEEAPVQKTPHSIEGFFETIAEQIAPKQREVPDWPESRERPDYIQEKEEFEVAQAEELEEERVAEIIPMPMPEPLLKIVAKVAAAKVQLPTESLQTAFSGSHGIRIPGMNSFVQSGKLGNSNFRIEGKQDLRRAMYAQIIFSSPRALDCSYDNTIAK